MSNELETLKTFIPNCVSISDVNQAAIIFDSGTREIASLFLTAMAELNIPFKSLEIPPLAMHGDDPGREAEALMLESSHVFGLTQFSMAHSEARQKATQKGVKYLSLPDYSLSLLSRPCMLFNFREIRQTCENIKSILDSTRIIQVKSPRGTDLTLNVKNRLANSCPGSVLLAGELGSPPDAEVNIPPLETYSTGKIIIDGSIPHPLFGKVENPITLILSKGGITDFSGTPEQEKKLEKVFSNEPKKKILGEFGIGLNNKAILSGHMLEDEGCAGTVHFGFGSNSTIGGVNSVPFHLDFIMKEAQIYCDGKELVTGGV